MKALELAFPRVSLTGLAVLAALLVTPLGAHAQPSATVSLGRSFNSFNEGSAAESGRSVEAGIEADHQAADGRLRLFYSLDAGTYTTPGDWGYYLNTTGATWRLGKQAEDGKPAPPATYVGGSLSWRSNGASWAAADYFALAAFANTERHPSGTSTVRCGYRLDMRNFPQSFPARPARERWFRQRAGQPPDEDDGHRGGARRRQELPGRADAGGSRPSPPTPRRRRCRWGAWGKVWGLPCAPR